ncbi:MAG TPA: carboxy terminal-processing peptidase [Polyangiaceae bacterium]|nr:carboxy terminal-processing peptidase [Polyangiaceae bacterium]
MLRSACLLLALALGCSSSPPGTTSGPPAEHPNNASAPPVVDDLPEVQADPREELLSRLTAMLLSEKHLVRRKIDDALSKETFPKYIEQLDGAKLLLLKPHVDALSAYSDRMDDQLREGDLTLARKGAALVARRRTEVARMVADILAKPFDFNTVEEVETDPKKLAFCKTEDELRERWRRNLKLQALERIQEMEDAASGKDKADKSKDKKPDDKALGPIPPTFEGREEKARKDLATRYEARFVRLAKPEALEPAEQFLNAIAAAYDPHTAYLAPAAKEDFDIAVSGKLEGIGALLRERDHDIVVEELVPGGAAWQQGKLEAGDVILAVAQHNKDPVDVLDMPIGKVVSMIRGPKNTVVTLTVRKADKRVETVAITRDVVHVEAAYARAAILSLGPKRETGYIQLPGFYGEMSRGGRAAPGDRNATDDVRALLEGFQKKRIPSVIIDLRGNGGGLLSHARDISGLFIERGPIVQTRDSDGKREVLRDADPSLSFSGDVVVLVDRFSASAAEILAAALQDYERALIVGTGPTHGKGTVQAVVELDRLVQAPGAPALGVFKLTMQQYYRVNGQSTQARGVMPDIILPDPASYVESGERTLFKPVPWSSIEPVQHARQPHAWAKPELAAASRTRVKANGTFSKVEAFAKLAKQRRAETREPLERKAWLAKRKRDKDAIDGVDPKLKDLKPLFTVEIVSDRSAPAVVDKRIQSKLDAWKDELARDPWLEEALNVLGDMSKKRPQ